MTIATRLRAGSMGPEHVNRLFDAALEVDRLATDAKIGLVVAARQVVSSPVAAIDFVSSVDATSDEFWLAIHNAIPSSDGVGFQFVVSTDGGASFVSADYSYEALHASTSAASAAGAYGNASASEIYLSPPSAIGNAANEVGWSGLLKIFRPSATQHFTCLFDGSYINASGNIARVAGTGRLAGTTPVNGLRLKFQSGNITSCIATLYSLRRPA